MTAIGKLRKIGVDGAIFYSSLARVIQGGSGLIIVLLIASFLTKEEQGYYYTFGSVLAMKIFFELGLNGIITQFVAHEAAHLSWKSRYEVEGNADHLSRLASLVRFCAKWYSIFTILFLLVLIVVGLLFFDEFGSTNDNIVWVKPWILLSIVTSLDFFVSPFVAILEGLGKVTEVAKVQFVRHTTNVVILILSFSLGGKLYAAGIAGIISIGVLILMFWINSFPNLIYEIWKRQGDISISYKNEIFPYQWKIAISWLSGYFIFQLFNPVLFATEGAVVAGKMGMTLAVLNGILAISINWISTKVPLFSAFIAKKEYVRLDVIFNTTVKQAAIVNGIGLLIAFTLINTLRYLDLPVGDRFLDNIALGAMIIPIFLNQFINAWATYLRSHKREPLLFQSVCIGILSCISTLGIGRIFGLYGITIGYLIVSCFSFMWVKRIFRVKKKEWHEVQIPKDI